MFITNPAHEFDRSPYECLELPLPICGLPDSVDLWKQTHDDHIPIDLEMTHTIIDPSLYCKFENSQSIGINGSYVDDLLPTGSN